MPERRSRLLPVDAIVEIFPVIDDVSDYPEQPGRQHVGARGQELWQLLPQEPRSLPHGNAVFQKKATDLIDYSCPITGFDVPTCSTIYLDNPTRIHLVEKLEKLVEEYNLGTLGVEAFFEALKALVATMEEEERRAAREGLSEDELAVFDLLTKPKPKLSKTQEAAVKKVARELLEKLQDQLAVAEWQT